MTQQEHYVLVPLSISSDELLAYYRGSVKNVRARDLSGKIVHFPLAILHPYISHNGITGTFAIYFDGDGKFVRIRKQH